MVGVDFPSMVRQARHERKIVRLLNLNPFALSLSKGERIPAGYILWRESPKVYNCGFEAPFCRAFSNRRRRGYVRKKETGPENM